MVRIKSRYKPPGYRTAQLVLVPVIAALLALGGLFVACNPDKESSWNSPRTAPTEAPEMPRPAARAEMTGAPASFGSEMEDGTASRPTTAPSAPSTTPATTPTPPSPESSSRDIPATSSTGRILEDHSDLREQQIFSARTEPVPESIQLTPCQRSAAACFESGGLGTLMDNLDGLSINHDTGRFCFSFQEGCERR